MSIERRTELEVRRELARVAGELYPPDSEPQNAYTESVRATEAVTGERMRDILSRALQDSADLGVSVSVRQFENVGFGFDYTLANENARDWALRYTDNLLTQLGTTTSRIVGQAVGRWINNGEPLQALVRDLRPAFGAQRAKLIASTEVTRAYAQGSKEAYVASGVVKKLVWQASMDERVCIYCGSLHGKVVGIEESFDGALPADLQEKTRPFALPPAHVGCRCWILPQIEEPKQARKPKPKPEPKPVVTPPLPPPLPPIVVPPPPVIVEPPPPAVVTPPVSLAADARRRIAEINRPYETRFVEIDRDLTAAEVELQRVTQSMDNLEASLGGRAGTPQGDQIEAKIFEQRAERNRIFDQRRVLRAEQSRLRDEQKESLRSVLYVDQPAGVTMRPVDLDANQVAKWQEGVNGFNRLVSADVAPARTVFFTDAPSGRSGYNSASKFVRLETSADNKEVVHELGHWLEDHNHEVHRKAIEFYQRRTAGEPLEWMGPGYDRSEVTRRDKFLRPYMGKYYTDGRQQIATEIVSMGIEYFYAQPLQMATEDPDMFDFIFNLLRGR